MLSTTVFLAALATLAAAKTDLAGCTSSASGASLIWWDPTNGEICSIPDCGGGRAPAKTTVPGCAAYEGTATYSPEYLPGWGEATATPEASSATYAAAVSSAVVSPVESAAASSSSTEEASTLITSAASLALSAPYPTLIATGTGTGNAAGNATASGTGVHSATLSASAGVPESTGAAGAVGVAQGVLGFAVGAVGLALL